MKTLVERRQFEEPMKLEKKRTKKKVAEDRSDQMQLNWGAALFGSVSRETLCMAVVLVGEMNSLAGVD
jgi:hypothetical protein